MVRELNILTGIHTPETHKYGGHF